MHLIYIECTSTLIPVRLLDYNTTCSSCITQFIQGKVTPDAHIYRFLYWTLYIESVWFEGVCGYTRPSALVVVIRPC